MPADSPQKKSGYREAAGAANQSREVGSQNSTQTQDKPGFRAAAGAENRSRKVGSGEIKDVPKGFVRNESSAAPAVRKANAGPGRRPRIRP